MHVVVLGAGLAGLATAYDLLKAGHQVTIVEKDGWTGGMATSWKTEGYWLDHGPHRFHSRDPEIVRHLYEVLDNQVVIRERLSRIYMQGRFFHYPLQATNVLKNLPTLLLIRALFDYFTIRISQLFKPIPDSNFENWVLKRFGRTLYKMFFGTYTSKAWKMDCTEISADWASQRISQANLWDTIVKTLNPPKDGEVRSLVSEFWYPAHGGIGEIGRRYGDKVREMGGTIHLRSTATRIEIEDDIARSVMWLHDGEEKSTKCDMVVNTIPLPRCLEAFSPSIDAETQAAIKALRYIGIVFVYLEVDQPSVSPDHWIYLPEKHLTIHRISEFKNFSDDSAPGEKTAICCEITCNEGDEHWNMTLEEAARLAEKDLITVGLIEPGKCRGIDLHRLKYAYPVYDLTYKQNLNTLKRVAKGVKNLHTTGRQGLYRYNNMDHSIAMGRRVARTLCKGVDQKAEEVAATEEYFG